MSNPDAAGFGVYIHWPFCASKCPYCDFNSHVRFAGIDEAGFRDMFVAEIASTRRRIGPRRIDSIFLGGGTPSLMAPGTVGAILDAVASHWDVAPDAEITLEANPSSVEADRFTGYRAAGINRVSLGVQALADTDLKALGRLHTAAEARRALDLAAAIFSRFSFDLIYARPQQTPALWERELRDALAIGSRHISLYQLTIEEGTPFAALNAAGKLSPPDAEVADELFRLTDEMTRAAGMPAYEISNHAVRGEESRHNILYWRYGEYAGIGPGAHGRLIIDGVRRATATERHPETWRDRVAATGNGLIEDTALSAPEQADEALLMGLRLTEGVSLRRLIDIGGMEPAETAVDELVGYGLIEKLDGDRLRASPAGRFILNEIVLRLSSTFVSAR